MFMNFKATSVIFVKLIFCTYFISRSQGRKSTIFDIPIYSDIQLDSSDDPRCPCLGYEEIHKHRVQNYDVSDYLNEEDVSFYGVGCGAHDISSKDCTQENICDVTLLFRHNCEKSWCKKSWCYVDAENCDLYKTPSVLFQDRYYSYATCGFIDTISLAPMQNQVFRVARNANTGGWKGAFNPEGSFALNDLWHGPSMSFFEEASLLANITFNFTKPPESLRERSIEYFDSTSSFDYCVYAVALGYLDFCISGYTINSKRTKVTPFFQVYTNYIYIIFFTDDDSATWETFLANIGKIFEPFAIVTWVTISMFLFIIGLVMFVLEYKHPGSPYQDEIPVLVPNYESTYYDINMKKVHIIEHIVNSVFRSSLSMYHRNYVTTVVTTEGKINLFGIASFILIVTAIYVANLAAILTKDIRSRNINTIDEAIHQGYNFCSERNLGLHMAETYQFDMSLLVPDPIDLGGDGKPGFACPKCKSRERTFEQMRRSHSDPSLYCNAAFAYDEDLELYHNVGEHCDKEKVIVLGKVPIGIPINKKVFSRVSSIFHETKYRGTMEKALAKVYPESKCIVKEDDDQNSLTIMQLSGVWLLVLFFIVVALSTRWIRSHFGLIHFRKTVFSYDQWGNESNFDDFDDERLKRDDKKSMKTSSNKHTNNTKKKR